MKLDVYNLKVEFGGFGRSEQRAAEQVRPAHEAVLGMRILGGDGRESREISRGGTVAVSSEFDGNSTSVALYGGHL